MKRLILASILVFLFIAIGCSRSSNPIDGSTNFTDLKPLNDPVALAKLDKALAGFNGQIVLGTFEINADPETGELEIVPTIDRNIMAHYNVTDFLRKPLCPIEQCWDARAVYYDPQTEIWDFELLIYNPTIFTAYDVRALFYELYDYNEDYPSPDDDIQILNADGWTKIKDVTGIGPDMNPYILFNKEQMPEEENSNYDPLFRAFEPKTLDSEHLIMHWPAAAPTKPHYIILASYPDKAEEVIQYFWVDQRPFMNPAIGGFSYITTAMFDHQGEDPDMHVYLSCPEILGMDGDNPVEVEMQKWFLDPGDPTTRQFLSWIVRIDNLEHVTAIGDYTATIRAVTPNEGDFDTYYKFPLKVRKNPGGEGHTDYDAPIAWVSFQPGDADVFVANDIFLQRTQNATDDAESQDLDPTWAVKGNFWYLYFASNANYYEPGETDYDLYVHIFQRSPDGEMVKISPATPYMMTGPGWPGDERAPCVSPNLDFMVFQAQEAEGGDWEIIRANLNIAGPPTSFIGSPVNLTNNAADDQNPTINIFGNYILFDSNMRNGNIHDIFGMNPTAGSQITMILESGYDDIEPSYNPYYNNYFLITRKDNNEWDIGRVEIAGTQVIEVINLTYEFDSSDEKHSSWSPSGEQIIFQSNKGEGGDFEIWTMDKNGELRDQMTNNEEDDISPAWGPVL
jgi:Tol biopolymer transport system component